MATIQKLIVLPWTSNLDRLPSIKIISNLHVVNSELLRPDNDVNTYLNKLNRYSSKHQFTDSTIQAIHFPQIIVPLYSKVL